MTSDAVVRRLRADIETALGIGGKLAEYVRAKSYAFTVLVESADWADELQTAIQRAQLRDDAFVYVAPVPSREKLLQVSHERQT